MDGSGVDRALRAQDLRRLARECRELDLTIHMLGKVPGQRGLARTGIAEQAEDLRPACLQPAVDGLERRILLRRKFHGGDRQDSLVKDKAAWPAETGT